MRKLGLWMVLAAGCNASAADPAPAAATTAEATPSVAATASIAAPASASARAAAEPAPEAAPAGMVRIPAGIFVMGAYAAVGNPEEKPAHEAIVPSFFMDETEVTTAAYQKCVAAGACRPAHTDQRFCNTKPGVEADDHPINCVDLMMADAYCKWAGKRLPTEREWEYAASNGDERRRFSWGPDDPTPDNACYDHPGGSCPVKQFAPGAFGLYDMTGNVWEWTASRFDPYPSRDTPDTIEKKGRLMYVYRGGSWSRRFPKWMRNLLRNRYEPDQYSASIGMRCVKPITPLDCPADTEARGEVCVRVRGETRCEPHHVHDGKACVPDVAGETAKLAGTWPPPQNTASTPPDGASAAPVSDVITRSRTPQHDPDCQRHWPATPASYLFTGGANYPARKPAVAAAGCVPRDMGWSWTSACCPG